PPGSPLLAYTTLFRSGMDGGRRNVRRLRDERLDLGQRAGHRPIGGGGLRLIDAAHVEELLDHEALLHLLRRRGRELVLGPDGPADRKSTRLNSSHVSI